MIIAWIIKNKLSNGNKPLRKHVPVWMEGIPEMLCILTPHWFPYKWITVDRASRSSQLLFFLFVLLTNTFDKAAREIFLIRSFQDIINNDRKGFNREDYSVNTRTLRFFYFQSAFLCWNKRMSRFIEADLCQRKRKILVFQLTYSYSRARRHNMNISSS